MRVEPRGSGSRIHLDYHRRSKTFVGRTVGALFQLTGGAPIKSSLLKVHGRPE